MSSGHHSQRNSLIQLKNCFTSFSSETFRANYKEFYITVTTHTLEENFPFTHILDTLISTCTTSITFWRHNLQNVRLWKVYTLCSIQMRMCKDSEKIFSKSCREHQGGLCGFLLSNIYSSVITRCPCSSSWQVINIQENSEGIRQRGTPDGRRTTASQRPSCFSQELKHQGSGEVNQPTACGAFISSLQSI